LQVHNFPGLFCDGIQVWRGDRHVLRGVSLSLRAGEVLHVAGANGTGKTTLLRVCAGLLAPEQGSVRWGSAPISDDRDAYASGMAFLAHSDGLKAELSARENLAFEAGIRRELSAAEIDSTIARVGLGAAAALPARALSAGQRRRLALARVLLAGAALWLLDEPFTNLDAAGVELVSDAIAAQAESGGAVLFAAHQAPGIPRRAARQLELA
jgi:heme exporter protein A